MKLSILIPTTVRRVSYYCPNLVRYLSGQIEKCKATKDIQLLWLGDNKTMSVGEKRNLLLDMARGTYLVFIDDDDSVAEDYIACILRALKESPGTDVIVYECITMVDGKHKTLSRYSHKYTKYLETKGADGIYQWQGLVAHTMVWKSEIAKRHRFPDRSWTEDMDWVKRANKDIVNEASIPKPLYFYRMYHAVSETRGKQ